MSDQEPAPATVERPPVIVAAAVQGIAALLVFGTGAGLAAATGTHAPLMVSLTLQGAVAAVLGFRYGLASWWVPIHLALPPAVGLAMQWPVPGWVFGAAFAVLALVYWNSTRGVPLYLTNPTTRRALADLLSEREGVRFVDLGAGFAGPVLALARMRPGATFTAVESAPMVFCIAWARIMLAGSTNVSLRFGNLMDVDLGAYDVAYCFLSPVPMPALLEKARGEMRPGSVLVSNTFAVPGHPATETIAVDDRRGTQLHVWRF